MTKPVNPGREAPYFELDDRVELVRHARDTGRNNEPSSAAQSPNDVEAAIEREYLNRHRAAVESARGDIRAIVESFGAVEDRLMKPRDLLRIPTSTTSAIEQELAEEQRVETTRRAHQLSERDVKRFQREHGLAREARYPASRTLHLAAVALVLLVESIMNSAFFSASTRLGLLGGFLLAVGVSLTNIGLGVASGYFLLRGLRHHNRRLRVAAAVGTAIYIMVAIVFNIGIARLRDELAAGHGGFGLDMAWLLGHPLALTPLSLALLILGLIASAFGCLDGFTLDDSVPGYGAIDRARLKAATEAGAAEASVREQVLGHVERVPGKCSDAVAASQRDLDEMRKLAVDLERRMERYESERVSAEHWCHVGLKRYRSENMAVRTTPPPPYFAELPVFAAEVDTRPLEELRTRLGKAREQLDQIAHEAHGVVLEQPARMASARERLTDHIRTSLQRADGRRGDTVIDLDARRAS